MRKPLQRLRPRSSGVERPGHLGAKGRGDPSTAFFGFQHREDAHFAGDQEAERVHGMPHPAGVGDDRNPFPLRQVVDGKVEIVPASPGKA